MSSDTFIVKVQLSLHQTGVRRRVLIYDEDRAVFIETEAPRDIIDLMKGRAKAFCEAEIVEGKLNLIRPFLPDQGW